MRFIRFKYGDNTYFGFEKDNKVVRFIDLELGRNFKDLNDFIANHTSDNLKKIKDYQVGGKDINMSDVEILAPIEKPIHDIICIGLNYQEHINESDILITNDEKYAENAIYFSKRAIEIKGPKEFIRAQLEIDNSMDYECELAVIIGKEGKDISEEDAMQHVFGLSIINDLSARSLQKSHGQWYKGKSLDGYTAMGPAVVHISEFNHPIELNIKTKVNGEIRQHSNTKHMIRDIPRLIYEISKGMTLVPGDILATGTPKGVGIGFSPPRFLKYGDNIKLEIDGIGILENTIV